MITAKKWQRLSPYEECSGPFADLAIEEGGLVARVGKVNLILPLEMEADLRPFLGKRIAILRTDIQLRQYIIRAVCLEGGEGGN